MSQDHSQPVDDVEFIPEDTPDGVTLGGVHHAVVGLTVQVNALATQVLAERIQLARQDERFDTFHGELSLMRGMLGDLIPRMTDSQRRLGEVEKSVAAKVGGVALGGVKITVYVTAAVAVLGALAKQWPWLQGVADALRGLSF